MRAALISITMLVAACAGTAREPRAERETEERDQGPAHAAAPDEPAPPSEPVEAGAAFVAGGACEEDADCSFDDPCTPAVCGAGEPSAVACAESRPPPGRCLCHASRCTLRRDASDSVGADLDCDATSSRTCRLDVGRGTCAPGTEGALGALPGPRCYCDGAPPRRCHLRWVEPVPCRSVSDCWVEVVPFPHPVPRARSARGRRFVPCRDGEQAPVCDDGVCGLLSYGC